MESEQKKQTVSSPTCTALLDCRCGSTVEVDWGGCTEYYGGTWQDVNIMCSKKCGYSVDITINADIEADNKKAKKLVIETWNILQAV